MLLKYDFCTLNTLRNHLSIGFKSLSIMTILIWKDNCEVSWRYLLFFLELPPQSIFKDIIIKIKIHKNQDLQKFPIEDVPRLPKLLVGLSSYTSYETRHDGTFAKAVDHLNLF